MCNGNNDSPRGTTTFGIVLRLNTTYGGNFKPLAVTASIMPCAAPPCPVRFPSARALPCLRVALLVARHPSLPAMASLSVLTFDHEGRPIQFDTWLDDLNLYHAAILDSVSLFDHTSGASLAPPATAHSVTRSKWLTRDAAARLAIRNHLPLAERAHFGQHKTAKALYIAAVARYSSPATTALGRLILPYLFPELSAFATFEDLITHLRTSDTRYRAALLAEFLDRNPPPIYITLYFIVTRCFFRDSFTPTQLPAPFLVRLADPAEGPVLARSSTVLPCPAVLSGSLSSLHLPSFSTNLVSTAALQDAMVTTTTPGGQRVSICTCTRTGRQKATFTRRPGSSLYTLSAEPPQAAASSQASASGLVAAPCSCRLLSLQTLLWHHRLGHPSLPRLRGMHSCLLVSGLPRSLPPLPPSPAPPCLPCIEGRQHAAPHSSFPPTTAPLQTLHMDVWGPARVSVHSILSFRHIQAYCDYNTTSGGSAIGGAESASAEPGDAEPEGAEPGGAESEGAESGGAEPEGAEPVGAESRGAGGIRAGGARVAGPGGARTSGTGAAGAGGVGGAGAGDPGARGTIAGDPRAGGTGAGGARARGTRAGGAGASSFGGAGVRAGAGGGDAGAGDPVAGGTCAGGTVAEGAGAGGAGAGGPGAGGIGAGDPGAGGAGAGGAGAGGAGAGGTSAGGTVQRRPFFVPPQPSSLPPPDSVLCQVLNSPLPAPSPYAEQIDSLTEHREPESHPTSLVRAVCTSHRVPRPCPPLPGTHIMALRLPPFHCEFSCRLLLRPLFLTFLTLIAELVDFAPACRLDYTTRLVVESESDCPPSLGGECALCTDVLEDRQEDFECLAAAVPHLVAMLLAPEGDPDSPDIPTPCSYAEVIRGTYVDAVLPSGVNIVDGMWIFRVKQPPGSLPVFKARYIARGLSQRPGVDFFQTFSSTPKMTTLWVLLHVTAQHDYELHSLDFSTTFLQGSLHEEIWLRRPPGFNGFFLAG
ncbi:unnamed protein product [Closterium sp. NIES-53]